MSSEPFKASDEDWQLLRKDGGWEIWGEESRNVIRIVARWLRKKRYCLASAELHQEVSQ
jgi:hypothetical protein